MSNVDKDLENATNPSVKRCRKWAITIVGDVVPEGTIGNAHLYIGPAEVDAEGNWHRHGLILGKVLDNGDRQALTKQSCIAKCRQLGLTLKYIQAVRCLSLYIKYMYKQGNALIPQELEELTRNASHSKSNKNVFKQIAEEAAKEFKGRPSYNAYKEKIFERCFTYPQTLLKRAYESVKFGEEGRFEKRMKKAHKVLKPELFKAEPLRDTIEGIIENIDSVSWNGKILSKHATRVIILTAAVEARSPEDGILISPHILIHGKAGTGKTFLGQCLFPQTVATSLPTDSEGVGQVALRQGHNVLKIDDAGTSLLTSKKIVDTVKTMYQNVWEAKVHGDKVQNSATLAFITTNLQHPLTMMSLNGETAPLKRRFLQIKMGERQLRLRTYKKLTDTAINQALWTMIRAQLQLHEIKMGGSVLDSPLMDEDWREDLYQERERLLTESNLLQPFIEYLTKFVGTESSESSSAESELEWEQVTTPPATMIEKIAAETKSPQKSTTSLQLNTVSAENQEEFNQILREHLNQPEETSLKEGNQPRASTPTYRQENEHSFYDVSFE